MPLNTIIVSGKGESNPLIEKFLQQARFLNETGRFTSLKDATANLESGKTHYVLLDLVSSAGELLKWTPTRFKGVRMVLFSADEVFMLEGFPEDLREALMDHKDTAESLETAPGGLRLRLGARDMTLELRPQESRVLLDPIGISDQADRNSVFIKSENKINRIAKEDLIYLESQKDYVIFHARNRTYRVLSRMKNIAAALGEREFLRIHRSYLVRIDQIQTIEGEYVYIQGSDEPLPIGPSYKSHIMQTLRLV